MVAVPSVQSGFRLRPDMNIRRAEPDDAVELLEIYRPIVEQTAISFELVVPSVTEFSCRIESVLKTHEWLVMEKGETIIGYAYASPHRAREAYQFSTETSVYVRPGNRGEGVANQLYEALFDSIRDLGFRAAFAGIALPNDASIALHSRCGFEEIGTFCAVGYKFDQWHDVSWWQRKV